MDFRIPPDTSITPGALNLLSPDTWEYIFYFLDIREKKQCFLVNKLFYSIISTEVEKIKQQCEFRYGMGDDQYWICHRYLGIKSSYTYHDVINRSMREIIINKAVRLANQGFKVNLDLTHITNRVTDEMVCKMTNLYKLNLYCCETITDKAISKLGKLDTLQLGNCIGFTGSSLHNLCNLRKVYLGGCKQLLHHHIMKLNHVSILTYPCGMTRKYGEHTYCCLCRKRKNPCEFCPWKCRCTYSNE
jgi:hypothetical protein